MDDMTDPFGGRGEQVPGAGPASFGSRRNAKVRLGLDVSSVDRLATSVNKVVDAFKKMRDLLKDIKQIGVPGGPEGGGGKGMYAGTAFTQNLLSKATGALGGGGGPFPIASAITSGLTAAGSMAGQAIENRVTSNYAYSLSADKLSVMYQQMTGMSQQRVQDAYRYPLMNYRLGGPGAINPLLQMQATTGINAFGQASSMEAMRTMTGYGLSSADTTNIIQALGTPEVANRMFMTMGGGLYGIGGQQRSGMEVMQRIVQSAGLTNKAIVAGAFQQGSASRMRLDFLGVPKDMQDMVLQYAQQNLAFKEKGGTGLYDPSKEAHRRMMGIEENFATQREETDRLKALREENFYNRQADNFAALERQTQTLTKAFGALEDKLSGIIGAKTSLGPTGRLLGNVGSSLGSTLMTAGGLAALTGVGATAAPFLFGTGAVLSLVSAPFRGDPMPGASATNPAPPSTAAAGGSSGGEQTYPTYSGPRTLSQIKSWSTWRQMHPNMQQRIEALMRASKGKVGFGDGVRTDKEQLNLFLSRYRRTDKQTDIIYNGSYWEKLPGVAPAAPPGQSMHNIGLAADLVGDMEYIKANSRRFGLRDFNDVNSEPWHVQPVEHPGSVKEYGFANYSWGVGPFDGTNAQGLRQMGSGGLGSPSPSMYSKSEERHAGQPNRAFNTNMSVNEIIAAANAASKAAFMSGIYNGAGASSGMQHRVSSGTRSAFGMPTYGPDQMRAEEMIALVNRHGWISDKDAIEALAVTWKESRWHPRSHNVTNENSIGLFQINMNEAYGPSRRKRWGLKSNEELFDPDTNARAARSLYDISGWHAWGMYANKNPFGNVPMDWMASVYHDAKRGDPMPTSSGGGGGGAPSTVYGDTVVTISPVINMYGSNGASSDLMRIAKEVGNLIKQEVALTGLRGT